VHFADTTLAARLEALVAEEGLAFAEAAKRVAPEDLPDAARIAGGTAMYIGPGSPVNQADGCGFAGEVTEADVLALEAFYRDRRVRPLINVCPLADRSLRRQLAARGWTVDRFENVLIREMDPAERFDEMPAGVEVREVTSAEDRALWSQVVANGFAAPDDPSPAESRLSRIAAERIGAQFFLAFVDGAPAGTGELIVSRGVGWLSADTTLPQFRGRGVQRAVQQTRLRMARDAGCDLAAAESDPGSGSQRNMERLGFRIAYTRVTLVAPNV